MISICSYKNRFGGDTIDFRGWYHFSDETETRAIFFWDFVPAPPDGYKNGVVGPFRTFENAKSDVLKQWIEERQFYENKIKIVAEAIEGLEYLKPVQGEQLELFKSEDLK